jgi:hypothetical protein
MTDQSAPNTLHDWLYDLVCQVCYDRDYLYLSFVRHFGGLMATVEQAGPTQAAGTYAFAGLKSGLRVDLTWRLARRLDWLRSNWLALDYRIVDAASGEIQATGAGRFDVATGERVPV